MASQPGESNNDTSLQMKLLGRAFTAWTLLYLIGEKDRHSLNTKEVASLFLLHLYQCLCSILALESVFFLCVVYLHEIKLSEGPIEKLVIK